MADKIKKIKANSQKEIERLPEKAPILEVLSEARLKSNKSLTQMSKTLNIQIHYLKALEEGDLSSLPEDVYTLGFVRTYGNFLGLDGTHCAHDYREQLLMTSKKETPVSLPKPLKESMSPKKTMLIMSVVLGVGGYMGWLYVSEQKHTNLLSPEDTKVKIASENASKKEEAVLFDLNNEPEIEDPFAFEDKPLSQQAALEQKKQAHQIEESLKNQSPTNPPTALVSSQNQGHSPSQKLEKIIIEASQKSWIEIKNSEKKILYRGVLNPGETYEIPGEEENLIFTTGNAGGISFLINGKKTPLMGESGQVIRRVPLTKESLWAVGKPRIQNEPHGDENRVTTRERNQRPTP